MNRLRVMFFVRRVGPYHDARFEAAGREVDLTVVETRPGSQEYPWTTGAAARGYRLRALPQAAVPEEGLRGAGLREAVQAVLAHTSPQVVATAGWADPEYHVLLRLAGDRGVPAVVMSDSTHGDEPRRGWREWLKGSLVRNYAAAVVAGTRSRDYLESLGFHGGAINQPWDVVDNAHFATAAELRPPLPTVFGEKAPGCFLCVARFIPKKNLGHLLEAYARYVSVEGDESRDLVLSGSGPLEGELRRQVAAAGLEGQVHFAGFRQYPDLPALYAQAVALILPSRSDQWGLVVNEAMAAGVPVIVSDRCGCASDLVREGENGMVFDPDEPEALQRCLHRMGGLSAMIWSVMGENARTMVAQYSPESFGRALRTAALHALDRRAEATPGLSRLLMTALAGKGGMAR